MDSDYEFSRRSMLDHWDAGYEDAHRTLQNLRWKDCSSGLKISARGDEQIEDENLPRKRTLSQAKLV